MSAELRAAVGLRHVTVVPENFEAEAEVEADDARSEPDPESDPTVPRHR